MCNLALKEAWQERRRLLVEAMSLDKKALDEAALEIFRDDQGKTGIRGSVEGMRLDAAADMCRARARAVWADAIMRVRGNIKVEWKNWNAELCAYACRLETGEVFIP